MTLNSLDTQHWSPKQSVTEKTGIHGLLSRYRDAVKLILWTGILTAGGLTGVHAYKDDIMALQTQYAAQKQETVQSSMLKELSVLMIESKREWSQKWILWAIEVKQQQEGIAARFKLSSTVDTARKLEQFILETYKPEWEGSYKTFSEFSHPLSINKEAISKKTEFYESILKLYKLRNPGNDALALDELTALDVAFVVEFAVDMAREDGQVKKLDRYYIRRITLKNSASI